MDEEGDPDQLLDESILQPLIKREHLEKFWIGMGIAIDWIAMRGQPMSMQLYHEREDEAAEALVAVLADFPPVIAEALVRGAEEGQQGPLVPIPSGIWRQTATSDAKDARKPYRLIGTDDDYGWEGSILAVPDSDRRISAYRIPGYRRVQIRTDFILENWPEHKMDIEPSPIRRVFAQAEIRRLIEKIVAITSVDLAPLTQREIYELVRRRIPAASRDVVRDCCRDLWPNLRPGPRSGRDPDRKLKIQKLGDDLIAAQLHN
jgi:hypothetical protein